MHALTSRLLPSFAFAIPGFGAPAPRSVPAPDAAAAPTRPSVEIRVCMDAADAVERSRCRARGRHLARQEDWPELGRLIAEADAGRALTPGGTAIAALLAEGARADAIEAVRTAIADKAPRAAELAMAQVDALLDDASAGHGVALVVALTHVDAAWAWRGAPLEQPVPAGRAAAFAAHMNAASRLLDRFDPFEHESPGLAAARCATLPADPRARDRVADDYEDLVDLAPGTPAHLRALGLDLLPQRFGSHDALERQARRTADRVADIWGDGGYAWVYMDALAADDGAFRRVDADRFLRGVHDILSRRDGQHMANLWAAYTGLTLSGRAPQGSARQRISAAFDGIVRDHLREVHPMVWAEARSRGERAARFEPGAARANRGQVRAISALAEHFAQPIGKGRRVVFEADGPRVVR